MIADPQIFDRGYLRVNFFKTFCSDTERGQIINEDRGLNDIGFGFGVSKEAKTTKLVGEVSQEFKYE